MERQKYLKEIRFRASRLGLKELDVTIGRFVETKLETLDDSEVLALCQLLKESTPDLLDLMTGHAAPGAHLNAALVAKIRQLPVAERSC